MQLVRFVCIPLIVLRMIKIHIYFKIQINCVINIISQIIYFSFKHENIKNTMNILAMFFKKKIVVTIIFKKKLNKNVYSINLID
jgi:hypothetical protein